MKIVHMSPDAREPATGDLFIGPVERQMLVSPAESQQVRVALVTFIDGAKNRMHRHDVDQVLVITEGEGIVQVDGQEEKRVGPGDVVLIPAGEQHWHGAAPGRTMSHLTITTIARPATG